MSLEQSITPLITRYEIRNVFVTNDKKVFQKCYLNILGKATLPYVHKTVDVQVHFLLHSFWFSLIIVFIDVEQIRGNIGKEKGRTYL